MAAEMTEIGTNDECLAAEKPTYYSMELTLMVNMSWLLVCIQGVVSFQILGQGEGVPTEMDDKVCNWGDSKNFLDVGKDMSTKSFDIIHMKCFEDLKYYKDSYVINTITPKKSLAGVVKLGEGMGDNHFSKKPSIICLKGN